MSAEFMPSDEIARRLLRRRPLPVMVEVAGHYLPVDNCYYHAATDTIVLSVDTDPQARQPGPRPVALDRQGVLP